VIGFLVDSFNLFSSIKSLASLIERAYHILSHQPIQKVGTQINLSFLINAHPELPQAIKVSVLIYL
jgi:hypothetical protein